MLAALVVSSLAVEGSYAESRSSATINGRTVTVVGGSSQSLSSTGEETVVMLDGRRIVIGDGKVSYDDQVHEIGDFTKLEIFARNGSFDIVVDGRPIE